MNSLLIAQNIVRRVFRSKKELIALVVLPIVVIGMITWVVGRAGGSKTTVGVVDLDGGELGRALVSRMGSLEGFRLVPLAQQTYKEAVQEKKVSFAMVIPATFSQGLEQGVEVEVLLYAGSPSAELASFRQSANRNIQALYTVEGKRTGLAPGSSVGRDNALSTTEGGGLSDESLGTGAQATSNKRDAFTSAIGFALVFMMTLVFTAMGTIVEDKRKLTLARMFVSPVREWEITAGNLLGSLFLGTLQLIPLVLILQGVFGIAWGSGLLGLFLTLFCFLIATIGLSIGLSGIIKGNINPMTIIATVIVPTSILGGAFIPSSMMPSVLAKLGYAVPQKWVMDAVYRIIDGAGIGAIVGNLGILLMFGLAFATFGTRTLRPLDE